MHNFHGSGELAFFSGRGSVIRGRSQWSLIHELV